MDPRLKDKIKEMRDEGVTAVDEIRRRLLLYSQSICPPNVALGNRRFFPTIRTVRNHMKATKTNDGDDQTVAEKFVSNNKIYGILFINHNGVKFLVLV